MKRRKGRRVTRLVLARRLDLSKSTVDRLVQAGVLKPTRPGRGGTAALFDLEKARRAVNGASTGADKAGQLRLVTTKLRASGVAQARLRERWAHDSEWRPSWDKVVARIRSVVGRWAETTAHPSPRPSPAPPMRPFSSSWCRVTSRPCSRCSRAIARS